MLKSILGTKEGMTQIFDETGNIVPVTVVSAGPCIVADICTKERNGYSALHCLESDLRSYLKEIQLYQPY